MVFKKREYILKEKKKGLEVRITEVSYQKQTVEAEFAFIFLTG